MLNQKILTNGNLPAGRNFVGKISFSPNLLSKSPWTQYTARAFFVLAWVTVIILVYVPFVFAQQITRQSNILPDEPSISVIQSLIEQNADDIDENEQAIGTLEMQMQQADRGDDIDTNTASIGVNAGKIATNARILQISARELATVKSQAEANADAVGRSSQHTAQNVAAIAGNSDRINGLAVDIAAINNNTRGIRRNAEGIAIAMASSAPPLRIDQRFSISLGYGNFDSGNAVAVSSSFRLGQGISLTLGGGFGLESNAGGGKAILTFAR